LPANLHRATEDLQSRLAAAAERLEEIQESWELAVRDLEAKVRGVVWCGDGMGQGARCSTADLSSKLLKLLPHETCLLTKQPT